MIEWMNENRLFLAVAGMIFIAVVYRLIRYRKPQPRKIEHDYFDVLWLWPSGSHTRWEAEVRASADESGAPFGLFAETTHDELAAEAPTDAEVAFCKRWLQDVEGLFEVTRPGLEKGWHDWFATEPPSTLRGNFTLKGFSVPKDGDPRERWEVTWFCVPANHFFSVEVRDGKASLTSIDG